MDMNDDNLRNAGRRLAAHLERTLRIAGMALERAQVGDADEAEALLTQVVTLDGRYVENPDPVIGPVERDHEHCAGRTCWQARHPCPEGGKSPIERASDYPPESLESKVLSILGRGPERDPNIMAMDLEDHQAPQTERWVRRALLRLAADIIELESTLGDYPNVEDLETRFERLETEDDDLEQRVLELENRFTDLEQP